MLHIVIFDEIDAICKTRGSVRDGTGVSDSVVNQLLSKIDGVDSLNNVLIIGMTNRKVRIVLEVGGHNSSRQHVDHTNRAKYLVHATCTYLLSSS